MRITDITLKKIQALPLRSQVAIWAAINGEDKPLTLGEMASHMGVTREYLSRLVSGRVPMTETARAWFEEQGIRV